MKDNVLLAAIVLAAAIIAAAILITHSPLAFPAAPCNCAPRYQVSVGANHAVIVDTSTGRTWEKYLPSHTGTVDDEFDKPKTHAKR